MYDDACDVMRVLETHVRPGLPRVERLVDAVAGVRAARGVGVTCPDPDDVGLRRRQSEVADRSRALAVEDRLPGGAVVCGLPDPADPARLVDRVEVILARRGRDLDVGDAHLHP